MPQRRRHGRLHHRRHFSRQRSNKRQSAGNGHIRSGDNRQRRQRQRRDGRHEWQCCDHSLTNVANAQTITVTLNNVNGSTNVIIPMRVLIGDVNSNGIVNASDVTQTKVRVGQTINATNFRSDVNGGGAINASDVSMIKAQVGTALP